MKQTLLAFSILTLCSLITFPLEAAAGSGAIRETVNVRCRADVSAFAKAVKYKVLTDMQVSGNLENSTVRVRVRTRGTAKKSKPTSEVLSGYVVSDVNSDPLRGVTLTGMPNQDMVLERCLVPVDVTVLVIIKNSGTYLERRTTSRIDLPGIYLD